LVTKNLPRAIGHCVECGRHVMPGRRIRSVGRSTALQRALLCLADWM